VARAPRASQERRAAEFPTVACGATLKSPEEPAKFAKMLPPLDYTQKLMLGGEVIILLVGLWVWWAFQLSPRSARLKMERLPAWPISVAGIGIIALLAIFGALSGIFVARMLIEHGRNAGYVIDDDFTLVLINLGLHVGVLFGLVPATSIARANVEETPENELEPQPVHPRIPVRLVVPMGVLTFAAVLPVMTLVAVAWQYLLERLGVPIAKQDLVDIFRKVDDLPKLIVMISIAVVVAPVMEEFVFRAGVFRHLRTRVPRIVALSMTAVLFAAMHANWAVFLPLVVLSWVFCIAYERTGRIAVPMVAHALFNLNTILIILVGLDF
jgi:uncharacterized protein